MKKLFSLSFIMTVLFLSTLQVGVTSCTKETMLYDTITLSKTDTIRKTDTVIIKDTAISMALLTSRSWKMYESRGVLGGNVEYYLRGGTNNTVNYDVEYITFRADGTGTYFDAGGRTIAMTWQFDNNSNTKLTYVLYNTPANFPVTYEHIRFKNNSLLFDAYYRDGNTGLNGHLQQIRTPR